MAQQIDTAIQYHGKKRSAESESEDQPLAKRFGQLYIEPIPNLNGLRRHDELPTLTQNMPKLTDQMLLDDTKETVFIHDIDREISESDAQENTISILPGVAGTLLSIPKTLITDAKPQSNELVLYQEPKSLSIPREQDKVRRAIAETRARARARQASLGSPSTTGSSSPAKSDFGIFQLGNEITRNHDDDDDAMDIDPVS